MERDILESDWKLFRQLHDVALDRFCERVLLDAARLSGDTSKSSQQRYGELYKLVQQRDEEIANAFNDMRRSTAIRQIVAIRFHELWTEEEFARFSPETRAKVQMLLDIFSS
jgi:hypothetical protein